MTFLLFANEYSNDILKDYVDDKSLTNHQLINIVQVKGIYSDFCQCSTDSFLKRIIKTILFYKYLCDLSSKFAEISVIVPCANHLYAGMLLSFAKKNKCRIDHVTEDTLNYCKRYLSVREIFN